MAYGQPDKAEKFSPRDHPEWLGKLFLVYPDRINEVVFTKPDGTPDPAKVAEADVAVIDLIDPQTGRPTTILGARIAGKGLVPQLTKTAGTGDAVLGRLRKLPAQGQKDGAYVLDDHTPQDVALAQQYEAQAGDWRGKFGQPSAASAATPAVPPTTPYVPQTTPPPAAPGSAGTRPAWSYLPGGGDVLAKLSAAGVDVAQVGDLATAQMIAQSL